MTFHLDLDAGTLSLSVNNTLRGVLFSDVPRTGRYYPCFVSLNVDQSGTLVSLDTALDPSPLALVAANVAASNADAGARLRGIVCVSSIRTCVHSWWV